MKARNFLTSLIAIGLLMPLMGLAQSIDVPTAPPEHQRPADFQPFRYKMTTEQLMEKYSAERMKRAETEFQEIAKVNEKGKWKPTWESLDQHNAPEWFLDAKLGLMLNWGLHSVPAWDLKKEKGAMYPDAYGNQMYHDAKFREYHVKNRGADFASMRGR